MNAPSPALSSPARCNCWTLASAVAAGVATPGLSDRFFADLAAMGQRRRTNPAFYLNVWCVESRLNPAAVNPKGGAQGLNQMMPKTLASLGAPANFAALPGEAQLLWIERLIAWGERVNGGPFTSAARYYHANFFPRTMPRGSSLDTVVVASDSADPVERAAYVANEALDTNHDGRITLRDLAALLEGVRSSSGACQAGLARLDVAVAALGPQGITWPTTPASGPIPAGRGTRPVVVAGIALAVAAAVGLAVWSTS